VHFPQVEALYPLYPFSNNVTSVKNVFFEIVAQKTQKWELARLAAMQSGIE
jgi:hypothetical protein